jgi:hypothetical protein
MLITTVGICINICLDRRKKPVKRFEYVAYLKFEFVTNKKDETECVIATYFLPQICEVYTTKK